MPIYAYDEGYNKQEIPSSLNDIVSEIDAKQDLLNATQGEPQTDYNAVLTMGVYYMPVTATNKPSNTTYILFVAPIDDEGSAIMQVAYSTGGTLMYSRVYSGGFWSPWLRWATYESVQQLSVPRALNGSTVPDSDLGKDGDTYYLMANGGIATTYIKINGNWMVEPSQRTFNGTTEPDTSLGKDGDTYYLTANNAIETVYVKLNDTWMEVTSNA